VTLIQRIILALLPASWAKAAQAESREWMMRCGHCGHEQSVWDAGGIRWRVYGNPRRYRRCVSCKRWSWQLTSRSRT
jgi:hypothetical protein